MNLHNGDCLEVMRGMPDSSVDLVLTDPPYGLKFMGKKWDAGVPSVEVWRECLRVLKPGGHCLAFAGTRTQHRMASAIEDAGFEIRDMLAWLYGSGFPKSHDISKAIDKAASVEREVVGPNPNSRPNMVRIEASVLSPRVDAPITTPATELAREWQGYGTALKPACEPITMARKPLDGTVAVNVAKHGTGGLNIDACRVGTDAAWTRPGKSPNNITGVWGKIPQSSNGGRWPANVIHDGSDEVLAGFPVTKSSKRNPATCGGVMNNAVYGDFEKRRYENTHGDSGSAARFFYCAKASKKERGLDNRHPTVKPIALMEYLCKLCSRPGSVVLDPFMGSGTTGVACRNLGREFIGIELDPGYFKIAEQRIASTPAQMEMQS